VPVLIVNQEMAARLGVVTGVGHARPGPAHADDLQRQPQQYLYDGANVAQEITGGSVSASILSGGTDEYFSRTDSSGTRSFLTGALGSTVAMADSSGTLQTSYTYEAFGKASSSGAADPNPLQFTGRENDGTGLQYNRARYYSPTLQRFISQDPLGFGGGDVNTSAYAGNSPTNFTDPSGEFVWLIPMAVGCVSMAAFSVGWDLISAKLTGQKLDVGGMLRDAGIACVSGAFAGFLGEVAGAVLGRVVSAAIREDGFAARMSESEAARYEAYWQRYAPRNGEPGSRIQWIRTSGRTGRTEKSTVVYDQAGRQRYRVDYTDHMRPDIHSNPHLHKYEFGPGYDPVQGSETVFNFWTP
jgi:RHS repeat-associated protein